MRPFFPIFYSNEPAQKLEIPNAGPRTPLVSSHDTLPQEASTQPSSGGGDRDEANLLVEYMVSFPRARHVISMGTLPGTFMVNDEGLPLKQVKLPGNF